VREIVLRAAQPYPSNLKLPAAPNGQPSLQKPKLHHQVAAWVQTLANPIHASHIRQFIPNGNNLLEMDSPKTILASRCINPIALIWQVQCTCVG
jgi:hypothetical protein